MIIAKSVIELCQKLTSLKENLENKGLKVNMKKTKFMFNNGVNMASCIWP